jgi:hypothetical protein
MLQMPGKLPSKLPAELPVELLAKLPAKLSANIAVKMSAKKPNLNFAGGLRDLSTQQTYSDILDVYFIWEAI